MNLRIIILALSVLLIGCTSEPRNTQTKSTKFDSLDDRVEFLKKYVAPPNYLGFRTHQTWIAQRTFETLDFDIRYRRGKKFPFAGMPSWDYRIVATVPASELPYWVSHSANIETDPIETDPDVSWLKSVPSQLDLSGVTEWYGGALGGLEEITVGVDRANQIVVCRLANR